VRAQCWNWSCAFLNSVLGREAGSLCWRLRLNIKLICKLSTGSLYVPIKKTVSPEVTPLQLSGRKLRSFKSLVKFHHHWLCTQVLLCWDGNKTRSCIWLNKFCGTTCQLTSNALRCCSFWLFVFLFPEEKGSADYQIISSLTDCLTKEIKGRTKYTFK
jgi:hypothetical protein